MKGTNEDLGKEILDKSALKIQSADDMESAAKMSVNATNLEHKMSILINKHTKVITQGITGKTGQFHTLQCLKYAFEKTVFLQVLIQKKLEKYLRVFQYCVS